MAFAEGTADREGRGGVGRVSRAAWAGSIRRAGKRLFDVVVSLVALVLLLPLLVTLAVVITLVSPGPSIFGQARVGRGGRRFRCLKFRTMYYDAEDRLRRDHALWDAYVANDFKLESDVDPRVTPVGRVLRATSLDELPQLLNVLVGHMSLVGPRPVVPPELASYGEHEEAYLSVRPGLTGPWQVSGRNDIRYPERARLDAAYAEGWTLRGDLWILLRTVPSVLRRKGVL